MLPGLVSSGLSILIRFVARSVISGVVSANRLFTSSIKLLLLVSNFCCMVVSTVLVMVWVSTSSAVGAVGGFVPEAIF